MSVLSAPSRRGLIGGAAALAAAPLATSALAGDDTLRVVMRAKWNRLLTPVWINGEGPIDFGIDTGASFPTIDTAAAEHFKLPMSDKMAVRGIVDPRDGTVNPALRQVIAHELITGGAFRETEVALGEVGFGGDTVSGFVTGAMFTFLKTRLDFPGGQALLYQSGSPDLAGFTRTPLFIKTNTGAGTNRQVRDPHLPIDVQIDGRTFRVILDTGAGGTVTLFPEAVRDRGLWSTPGIVHNGGGITGSYDGKLVRMQSLTIGGTTIPRPIVELIDPNTNHSSAVGVDGLIGMEVLRRFDMVIDANDGGLWFRPNALIRQALRYNRSGMVLGGGSVHRVQPGSPAEKAGIAVGDRVIFPNIGPDSARAFRWSLEDTPGAVVEFTVVRAGERRPVRLVLEDLI